MKIKEKNNSEEIKVYGGFDNERYG